MDRKLLTLCLISLSLSAVAMTGCGSEVASPEPSQVMERALRPVTLRTALDDATIQVASLGYEDRVLEQRLLEVPGPVLKQLRRALGDSQQGFRKLASNLKFEGSADLDGVRTDHISGQLDVVALIRAAERAGTSGDLREGLSARSLRRSLTEADFDLYGATTGGELERLDLTLSLDNPDNASPATRIRFSLTGESSKQTE